MIPDDIDHSLRTGEPMLESLDDGFSPPARDAQPPTPADAEAGPAPELTLGKKSQF